MIGAPTPRPPPRIRDRRRELWARWSSVSAKQEAALASDDLPRFLELDQERDQVESAVRDMGAEADAGIALDDPEVRARMEEILERERRIRDRLRVLRGSTLEEIRRLRKGVPGNARHARDYIRRDESTDGRSGGVDVRT